MEFSCFGNVQQVLRLTQQPHHGSGESNCCKRALTLIRLVANNNSPISYPTVLHVNPLLQTLDGSALLLNRPRSNMLRMALPQVAPSSSLAIHTPLKRLISACSWQLSSSLEWHSLSVSQKVPEGNNAFVRKAVIKLPGRTVPCIEGYHIQSVQPELL